MLNLSPFFTFPSDPGSRQACRYRSAAMRSRASGFVSSSGFHELTREEGQDGILPPQLIDTLRVFELRKFPREIAFPQPAYFVLVQIADVIAHELRGRVRGGTH